MTTAQEWLDKKYPNKKGVKKIAINVINPRKSGFSGDLIIADFPDLEQIYLEGEENIWHIPKLEVKNCPQLFELYVPNKGISEFSISNCPWLKSLKLNGNLLTSLDVSQNLLNLTSLKCKGNNLTSLDISNNPKLSVLVCDNSVQPIRQLIEKIKAREKLLTTLPNQEGNNQKISELEQEIQTLKDLKVRLENQESKLLTKINDLKIELQAEKDTVANLQTEYQELNKQLENIRSELALTPSTPHPEKQPLKDKVKFFNSWIKRNKQENTELLENIKKEQKTSQEFRNSLLDLEQQLRDKEAQSTEVEKLTKEKQELKKGLFDLNIKLGNHKNKVNKLDQENKDLKAQLAASELSYQELQDQNQQPTSYKEYWKWGAIIAILAGIGYFGYRWVKKYL